MSSVELCWNVTSYLSIIVQLIMAGVCLGIFVAPYLQERKKAVSVGAVYAVVMTVLYVMPPQIDNILAYFLGALAAFLVMFMEERRNVSQKIFLSVTFFSLRSLSLSMESILMVFLRRFCMNPKFAEKAWLQYGLYAAGRIIDILLGFLFLFLSFWEVNRVYTDKNRHMGKSELLMLIVPSLSGVAGNVIFRFYQVKFDINGIYDVICFLYYLISVATILVVIIALQNWKRLQNEQMGQELLESQISAIKTHIDEVEKLYGDIRSLRHDMGNHIQMIERLMAVGNSAEASAYLERLKDEWQELTPKIRTGNPVMDMILLEKKKEAEARGVRFECDFRYPNGTGLDAFDASVILYNVLNNCMESVNGAEPYIKIHTFQKDSVFMLMISNSFTGKLTHGSDGLPLTTKRGGGHGIGLKNIQRVAKKYMGYISVEQSGDEVTIGIMLQIL